MRLEIEKLHREIGATMIYVTHDQTEAMTLADRIVALDYGEVQQVGEPEDLYNAPTNTFVAGFIGSPKINFLDGEVTKVDDNAVHISVNGSTTGGVSTQAAGLRSGDQVKIGVRPEEFLLADDFGESALVLQGKVDTADRLGNITYAYVDTGLDAPITVQTFLNRKIKTGAEVTLSVPPDRIEVFNPEGRRCSLIKS